MINFSFILPVYNVAEYLPRCLDSILNQDYENLEVICINDGSTDNSLEILKAYETKDNRIKVISQNNTGLGYARNNAVPFVSGDYIWFVDTDDWILENALNNISKFIERVGNKDMFVFDYLIGIESNSEYKQHFVKYPPSDSSCINPIEYTKGAFCNNIEITAWSRIFRTETYKRLHIYFNKGYFEDNSIIPFYSKLSSIGYLDKPLYFYYMRPNSIMKTYDARVLDIFSQFDYILEKSEDNLHSYRSIFFYSQLYHTFFKAKQTKDKSVMFTFFDKWQKAQKNYSLLHVFRIPEVSIKRKVKLLFFFPVLRVLSCHH